MSRNSSMQGCFHTIAVLSMSRLTSNRNATYQSTTSVQSTPFWVIKGAQISCGTASVVMCWRIFRWWCSSCSFVFSWAFHRPSWRISLNKGDPFIAQLFAKVNFGGRFKGWYLILSCKNFTKSIDPAIFHSSRTFSNSAQSMSTTVGVISTPQVSSLPPNQTLYIKNLNPKINKQGT